MCVLGTGWFFGIFMSIPAPQFQVGMQYMFILLNSSQVSAVSASILRYGRLSALEEISEYMYTIQTMESL